MIARDDPNLHLHRPSMISELAFASARTENSAKRILVARIFFNQAQIGAHGKGRIVSYLSHGTGSVGAFDNEGKNQDGCPEIHGRLRKVADDGGKCVVIL